MKRILAFAVSVTLMIAGALLLAGSPVTRAEAGIQGSRCETIVVAPDAAYGIAASREIRICR